MAQNEDCLWLLNPLVANVGYVFGNRRATQKLTKDLRAEEEGAGPGKPGAHRVPAGWPSCQEGLGLPGEATARSPAPTWTPCVEVLWAGAWPVGKWGERGGSRGPWAACADGCKATFHPTRWPSLGLTPPPEAGPWKQGDF